MKSYNLIAAAAWLLAATLMTAGCERGEPRPRSNAELGLTPEQAAGRQVYDQHCLGCHQAYSSVARGGPTMQGVFRKRELPSGAPANDQRVREVIVYGRAKMPGFGHILTGQQVNDLLAYMHTL